MALRARSVFVVAIAWTAVAWLWTPEIVGFGPAEAQTRNVDDYVPQPAYAGQSRAPLATQSPRLIVTTLTAELVDPYGIQFLPDGRMLITELPGRIRIVQADGSVSEPLSGVPAVWATSIYGLHHIVLDLDFAENRLVYFGYAAPPEGALANPPDQEFGDLARRLVARARLSSDRTRLENVQVILEADERSLTAAPDGTLFIGTSGADSPANQSRRYAQDLRAVPGKVLRINTDGSIPQDNPWVHHEDANPAVYALGFRNVSGNAIHPRTGDLWTVENGPRGGDELNVVRAGRNYGWPVITYGREYSEELVGEGLRAMEGMEQPIYFWTPSVSPSSIIFYTGDLIPEWKGDALVSTLAGEHLSRLELVGDRVVAEERLFVGSERRIRTIAQGPDGAVYMLIAGEQGSLIKLTPKPLD